MHIVLDQTITIYTEESHNHINYYFDNYHDIGKYDPLNLITVSTTTRHITYP